MDVTDALELRYRPWLAVLWGLIAAAQVVIARLVGQAGGPLWLRIVAAVIAAGAAVFFATGRMTIDHEGVRQRGIMGRQAWRWSEVDRVELAPASRLSTVKIRQARRATLSVGTALWAPTAPGRLDPTDLATAVRDLAIAAGVEVKQADAA